MKLRETLLLGLALVVTAQSVASAVFIPPPGRIELKLTDGTGFFLDDGTPLPRGVLPATGFEDFTAFRITSYQVNNGDEKLPATPLTGIVTFLEYESDIVVIDPNPDTFLARAVLVDSNRPHTVANGGVDPQDPTKTTIGRFFLFENPNPDAGEFSDDSFNPLAPPSAVSFGSGLFDGFVGDELVNFTEGTLVATGSLIANENGQIIQTFEANPNDDASSIASTLRGGLVLDGGLWYDEGVVDRANFAFNLFAIDPGLEAVTPDQFDNFDTTVDKDAFFGGWLASSEDPVSFTAESTVIPEPVTAGLGILSLSAIAVQVTRRRRAA